MTVEWREPMDTPSNKRARQRAAMLKLRENVGVWGMVATYHKGSTAYNAAKRLSDSWIGNHRRDPEGVFAGYRFETAVERLKDDAGKRLDIWEVFARCIPVDFE